ncbi:radical SAM protein [Anaeromicropila populeti]|uniref:Radical SAM superfamily enzyme, MoaA/NifB/PqqE/SkfB family n=1 Tax=Anaeromicropila populeti TaxID=37658 RepID=A0A1I6L1A1_9FIRM|nr:radical SAM protein [Anaeromicropila populeti]SFR97249.1 Radical SAM superfamily enzyme, MoaA/NifB/PqqE/SkfB family [Anaeromicropila populeti]
MKTYKIREEKIGAMLFDNQTGKSMVLTEEQYQNLLHHNKEGFEYLYDNEGSPLFTIFRARMDRNSLPSDCLSAPSKVYFEITRRCNLKCVYCYNNSRNDFKVELDKERIFELIDHFYDTGTFEIRLTGGEPTLHPDLFELLAYLKKKDFFVSLATNGVWNENLIRKISETDIKIIIVSLDGPEAYHDSMRGKGTFSVVTNTIRELQRINKFALKINTVLCKENKDYIEAIVKLADDLGVKGVNFAPLRCSGRAANETNYGTPLTQSDMYEVVKKITELRKQCKVMIQTYYDILEEDNSTGTFPSSLLNNTSCAAGIEVAAINPFGEVYGCVVSPANSEEDTAEKRLFTAGNLAVEDFSHIWLDSLRWKIYRDLTFNKSKKCLECTFYSKKCFGNCIVDSYAQGGSPNAESPLCFVDLL